jgi:hypothetical protein
MRARRLLLSPLLLPLVGLSALLLLLLLLAEVASL